MSELYLEKDKFKLEQEKIITKYTDELNNLKEIFIEKLNILRNDKYIYFRSCYTTNPIEKYSENDCDIVLYNENNNEYNRDDFIKYLDNNDKVIYFDKLYQNINQKCNIKDIKDLENLEPILKINKLEEIFNHIKNDFEINEFIKLEFKYRDVKEIINLRDSFKSYLGYRSNHISSIAKASKIGKAGEDSVNKFLNIYEDEIFNLQNIRLEIDGNSIENDNILISKHGIFVLEVKNIGSTGGYDIKIEKDGRWLKVYKNRNTEIIGYNATMQNDRHIVYLKKLINEKLNNTIDNYIDVKGIVVIANDTITINNESDQAVYRTSEIYRYITKHNEIFKEKQMKEIKEIILSSSLEPKKYPIIDFEKEIIHNIDYIYKQASKIDSNYLDEFENIVDQYKYERLNIESRRDNEIKSLEKELREYINSYKNTESINSYKNTENIKSKNIINKVSVAIVIIIVLILPLFATLKLFENIEPSISAYLTNELNEFVEFYDLGEDLKLFENINFYSEESNDLCEISFGKGNKLDIRSNTDSEEICGISLHINEKDMYSIWDYKESNIFNDFIKRKTGKDYSEDIKNRLDNYYKYEHDSYKYKYSTNTYKADKFIDDDTINVEFNKYELISNGKSNDMIYFSVLFK